MLFMFFSCLSKKQNFML